MSNRVLVERNAIEEVVEGIDTQNPPLAEMTSDPEFHIGHVQGRIAGISPGRNPTSPKPVERMSVLVITHCNGTSKNGLNVRKNLTEIRNAGACVILEENKVTAARVILQGRIVKIYPMKQTVHFTPLVTDTGH